MELVIQLVTIDKNIRIETIQDMKDYKAQTSLTQVKGGEDFVAIMKGNRKWYSK